MTGEEHQQLVDLERQGAIVIGVDRPVARRFFTDGDAAKIREIIGENLLWERTVIKAAFILGYVAILRAIAASIWAFGWWALLIGPAVLFLWVGYTAGSSIGTANLKVAIFVLVIAGFVALEQDVELPVQAFSVLGASSLFFARLTYVGSARFLRQLAMRNAKAFELLAEDALVLRRVG